MLTAVSLLPSVLRAVQVSSRLALGALAVATVLMIALAAPVPAHTDLDSTTPSDGATVDEPVEEVTLTFTLAVTQLGEGLSLQGPDGAVPVEVSSRRDGMVWVAVPQQPLVAGAYAGEWTVAAKDGHPLSGEFSFTVEAESADEQASTADDAETTTQAPADAGAGSSSGSGATSTTSSGENDGALGVVTVLARLAGAAALWGGLVAAGGLVFAAWVLTGRDRDDRPVILRVVRWSAALILLAVAIRIMTRAVLLSQGDLAAALSAEAISTSLGGTTRWVLGLQAAGALLVVVGARRAASVVWVAAVGVLAIGAGHVLAGHSNTVEPRWIVLLADVAHLLAAAVWVGGLVMLGVLLRHRRRRGRPMEAGTVGARFSVAATGSVAVVGVAGVVLALTILDRPDQLWQTNWGLLLVAKVAVVAVVGALGAYNHFRVVPALAARAAEAPDPAAGERLRRSATAETALMVLVVLLTAWLVAASVAV